MTAVGAPATAAGAPASAPTAAQASPPAEARAEASRSRLRELREARERNPPPPPTRSRGPRLALLAGACVVVATVVGSMWPTFELVPDGDRWRYARPGRGTPTVVVFDNGGPGALTVQLGEHPPFEVPAGTPKLLATEPGPLAFTVRGPDGQEVERVAEELVSGHTYVHDAGALHRYQIEELAFAARPERLKPRVAAGGRTFFDAGWITHLFVPAPRTARGKPTDRIVIRRLLRDRPDVLLEDTVDHVTAPDRRAELLALLAARGPEQEALVPRLLELLGAAGRTPQTEDLRAFLVEALGLVRRRPDDVLPALAQALSDPSIEVRARAARALGDLGPAAGSAAPELVARLMDGSAPVRLEALDALGVIAPADPATTVAPALLEVLGLPEEGYLLRAAAARALGALPHPPAAADLAARCEQALARLAAAPPAAISYYDVDPGLVIGAREGLWLLDRDAFRALPPLPEAVRRLLFAELALRGRARDEGPSGVADLLEVAADPGVPTRRRAVRALAWAGPDAPADATQPLALALASPDGRLAASAALALAWLGRRDALPALEAQREHADPHARRAVLRALEDLSP